VFVTILICTRNRPRELEGMLNSLLTPNAREPGWEVIIVDNGSTDDTPRVCDHFQAAFPEKCRILVEARAGKSNALNAGLAHARGDVLALTDDDVLCDAGYISGIREVFTNNSVDAAQGRVLLDFEGGRPSWLNERSAALLSLRDFGDSMLDWDDNLTGANMVVRRTVIERIGGFSPQIGAGAAGFMEDSEFSWRLRRSGYKLIYAPQILVRHQINRAQLQKGLFLDRYFRWGRSEAYLGNITASVWRFGVYVAKEFIFSHVASIGCVVAGNPDAAFRLRCEALHRLGFYYQHWRFATGRDLPLQSPPLLGRLEC